MTRETDRRLVLNPTSGGGTHVERVRDLADEYGFPIVETEYAGHGTDLAEAAAADGVETLAVCGGDGTLHEVVQGLVTADALDSVTLCVIPAGTENFFARDLGIRDLATGFEVAAEGETRRLDLGVAGDEPFVLSAIAGLPADASAAATHDRKNSLGPVAFVVAGIEEALDFDGLRVEIDAVDDDGTEREWVGEAEAILVGNARKFAEEGGQADAEDGLLEVTIIETLPARDALVEYVEQRVFQWETDHVTELHARRLDFESLDGEPVTFSLDGEIREFEEVTLDTRPGALGVKVGDDYESNPE
ncbi:diacylglycerol kinase family lipid kinase [Halorussus gelatinilyticus]|uniref:Diacylglycerol kinase family lipid kinase n=1 Tax=Halorussus gelatinilyticus TaxID=2937524 RepID=A0A8U0ID80_9EURY|nr:diacylglycerol kinase family protein [Halorussus gelatinilyticus]UPV99009.1 diacylglycerol kinase family lipid kinase [Halorussus gelatinilyticus]